MDRKQNFTVYISEIRLAQNIDKVPKKKKVSKNKIEMTHLFSAFTPYLEVINYKVCSLTGRTTLRNVVVVVLDRLISTQLMLYNL